MLRSNSLAIRGRWVIAARKGRAQVAQRVGVGPGGSWRPGVRVIAKQFGVDPGTVQRISRPFAAASVVVPPKIFSKEVAQNRPPHLPRQQPHSPPKIVLRQISGDEARMKFGNQKVPLPGVPYGGSAARQNEVGLAGSRRRLMPRARSGASILDCDRDALHAAVLSFTTVQKKCIG